MPYRFSHRFSWKSGGAIAPPNHLVPTPMKCRQTCRTVDARKVGNGQRKSHMNGIERGIWPLIRRSGEHYWSSYV